MPWTDSNSDKYIIHFGWIDVHGSVQLEDVISHGGCNYLGGSGNIAYDIGGSISKVQVELEVFDVVISLMKIW